MRGGKSLRKIQKNLEGSKSFAIKNKKTKNVSFISHHIASILNEIGFNLKHFLTLDDSAINEYLAKFNGLKTANLELLAELLFFFGENENSDTKRVFLEKALQLYELCKRTDKTYSFDREKKINMIIFDRYNFVLYNKGSKKLTRGVIICSIMRR